MSATDSVTRWTDYLQSEVLSDFGSALVKALALFSLAMIEARSCQSRLLAQSARSTAHVASRRRRWERLLANSRFRSPDVQRALGRAVAQHWVAPVPLLIVDETKCKDQMCCLKVSLGYRKRALPLAWTCYKKRPRGGQPARLNRLLIQATEGFSADTQVVVLADRGLCWTTLIDLCEARGWHYLLRLQGQTRVRQADGSVWHARDLCPRRGAKPWLGHADVFKNAGWRSARVIAQWPSTIREPWLLVTNPSACLGRWRQYAKRMWIEESFRDEKGQGFDWEASHVKRVDRTDRLLTVLAVAMLLAISVGSWLIKRGHRHSFDPRRVRRLSVFVLGMSAIPNILNGMRPNWPLRLYLCPS